MRTIKEQMDDLEAALPAVVGPVLRKLLVSRGVAIAPDADDQTWNYGLRAAMFHGSVTENEVAAAVAADEKRNTQGRESESAMSATKAAGPTRSEGFSSMVTVKDPLEKLSTHKYKARHPVTGGDVLDHRGREVYLPSEGENAIAGAYFKVVAQRAGIQLTWEEWERDYFEAAQLAAPWAGDVGGEYCGEIEGTRVKGTSSPSPSCPASSFPPSMSWTSRGAAASRWLAFPPQP
jgi:hypothetical protein